MGPAGAVITVLRNPTARKAILITIAALFMGLVVVVASVVAAIQMMLAQNCGTSGTGGGKEYVSQEPSEVALSDIPGNYLDAYRAAGEEYGIDWAMIAAVGAQETGHGSGGDCATSSAGAQGPMQFMPQTWATIGVDGNGDGEKNPCDFEDAIPATARYLVELGAPGDYKQALCGYYGACADGNADYANEVLAKADAYRAADEDSGTLADSGDSEESGAPDESASLSNASPVAGGTAQINLLEHLPEPILAQTGAGSAGSGQPPQGWDLVDDGRNIHYQTDSAYASYFEEAAADWNTVSGVNIEPAPTDSETDLVVTDGYLGGPMGKTYSDGRITFDTNSMLGATDNARTAAAAHELGHALGLPHIDQQSVMNTPIVSNTSTNNDSPTEYDARLAAQVWGSGSGGSGSGGETSLEGSKTAVFPVGKQYMGEYGDDWGADRGDRSHEGTDIMVKGGEEIYSIVAGTVKQSAGSNGNNYSETGGYNIMVEATESVGPIKAGDSIYYAHMQEPPQVSDGDTVEAGDVIGAIGSTGYGPEVTTDNMPEHLHLGWYDFSGDREEAPSGAMNPYPLLEWLKENGGTATTSGDDGTLVSGTPEASEECSGPLATLFGFTPLGQISGPGSGGPGKIQGSGTGKGVVEEAMKYDGNPYGPTWGGLPECIPGERMDCSCLTLTVFKEFGFDGANALPDAPQQQLGFGEPVEGEPEAGDLIVYEDPGDGSGGHVGIATGDGGIMHCASPRLGCRYEADYHDGGITPVAGIRRLVGD